MARPPEDTYGPCPCGSGQKYKFCCRERDREQRRAILREVPSAMGPDGEPVVFLDLEEGERLHARGLSLVERGRGREAIPILEKAIEAAPVIPNPYNNLALAYFLDGDVAAAIKVSERVDRAIDPGNTFALGNLVHFYILAGRSRDAERAADRLRGRQPETEDAAVRMTEAFARIGRHEDVLAVTRPESWRGLRRARIAFLQGAAAANLGQYARAQELLRGASGDPDHRERAKRYLDLLARRCGPETLYGDWPYFRCSDWVPPGYLDRNKGNDEALRSCPGLVQGMVADLNDDPAHDEFPIRILRQIGSAAALSVLHRVAEGTFGTVQLRLAALDALCELGEIEEGSAVKLWHDGEWTEVQLRKFEITEEAASTAPAWLVPEVKQVMDALHAGDLVRAEKLGRELLARAPDVPMVLQNLAAVLFAHDKPQEAETMLLRAMALDPGYVFARTSLASLRTSQGRTEEARKILAAIVLPERMHPQAYASFLSAQAKVALAEGNVGAAATAMQALESLPGEDEPSASGAFVRLASSLKSFLDALQQKRERQRRRLLAPDAGLQECLEVSTRERLLSIASALGLVFSAPRRKQAVLDRVAACLSDPGNVRALVDLLPVNVRAAFDDVLTSGGLLSHADFTRRHGSDKADEAAGRRVPETPLGRLKAVGLLAEGVVGGQASVLVPAEIRRALARAGENVRREDLSRHADAAHG